MFSARVEEVGVILVQLVGVGQNILGRYRLG